MQDDISSLSTYEISELTMLTVSTSIDQLMLIITVIFAYFAVAYLVGDKLTRFQLYSITFVYSSFTFVAIYVMAGLSQRISRLIAYSQGDFQLLWYIPPLLCFSGWVLSIAFMIHSRNQGIK